MSLKVYKNSLANRQYENTFFRIFQANLSQIFERQKLDGILIGFGDIPSGDHLYPDCVLITKNRILIIDFKNYDNLTVYLPARTEFGSKKWYTSRSNVFVKGGSENNVNPYDQLKKQRSKFEKIFNFRPNEDIGGIGCLVLFQGDVTISGEVPNRDSGWFLIADKYNYGNTIYDMIDLESKSKNDPEEIRRRYFECEEYIDNITIDLDSYLAAERASNELEKVRLEKNRLISDIEEQKQINQALRKKGESVEKGIELIRKKEELLEEKQKLLEKAQIDFDEKKNSYEIAENNYKKEIEKTKQEQEKTRQAELKKKIEREKTRQAEAKVQAAEIEHQEFLKKEHRKKIATITSLFAVLVVTITAIVFTISSIQRDANQKREERERQIQAIINEKKSGKTCVELSELQEYAGIKNVCVEYVVGNIASNSSIIYLNRVANTDFAAILWRKSINLPVEEAKSKYLNKRVRVRGTIKYYESEKYKYYQIEVNDLSQIEILD